MKHRRKLMLLDTDGNPISDRTEIDITDIPNADARATIQLVMLEMCDMNHWHRINAVDLAPWGE